MKELKGDDESKEEWDRLKWGSLHGLAKDKRNGMKQRTMGKPICMWSSSMNEQLLCINTIGCTPNCTGLYNL